MPKFTVRSIRFSHSRPRLYVGVINGAVAAVIFHGKAMVFPYGVNHERRRLRCVVASGKNYGRFPRWEFIFICGRKNGCGVGNRHETLDDVSWFCMDGFFEM